jgi:probable F420-dependent oxidoreductase
MDIYTLLPGVLLFEQRDSAFAKLRDVAQALEGLGLAGLCAGDHIVHYGWELDDHRELQGRHPDVFTFLAMTAAVTTRVRIASRIVVLPYRQPFATAHAFASLDVLSGGRAVFGTGPGYAPAEFEAFGIPLKERGPRTDEYLRLITALWTQTKVDFEGRFFSARGLDLLLKPLQQPRPPIWIGGFSHRAVERAVEFGDAWTPNCYTYPPDRPGARNSLSLSQFLEERKWADEQCRVRGRKPLEYVLSAGPTLRVSDRPMHAGRKRADIAHFTGEGTIEELIDEFACFNTARPQAFYVTFSGASITEYLRNAELFMTRVAPTLN